VGEDLTHGDVGGAGVRHAEVRHVSGHRFVEHDLALLDQLHHRGRNEGLRHGGQVEDRSRGDRLAASQPSGSEAGGVDDRALRDHAHGQAGQTVGPVELLAHPAQLRL
jgi:hypothetical protein